jgi:hypothetical protein
LFKSEQINEAQSSLLIPVKQSASPHQRRDAVKQNRSSISAERIIVHGQDTEKMVESQTGLRNPELKRERLRQSNLTISSATNTFAKAENHQTVLALLI